MVEIKKKGEIKVYGDGTGEIDGFVDWKDVDRTDTWGGARIEQEWQIGTVEIDGNKCPLMCDGDEIYVVNCPVGDYFLNG